MVLVLSHTLVINCNLDRMLTCSLISATCQILFYLHFRVQCTESDHDVTPLDDSQNSFLHPPTTPPPRIIGQLADSGMYADPILQISTRYKQIDLFHSGYRVFMDHNIIPG